MAVRHWASRGWNGIIPLVVFLALLSGSAPAYGVCPIDEPVLSVPTATCSTLSLAWTDVDAAFHVIEWRVHNALNPNPWNDLGPQTFGPNPYVEVGTSSLPAVLIDVRVRAIITSPQGCWVWSNAQSVTIKHRGTAPDEAAAVAYSNGTVNLSWTPHVGHQNVKWNLYRDNSSTPFNVVAVPYTNVTFTETCGEHTYQVQGESADQCKSELRTTNPTVTFPCPPTNLSPGPNAQLTGPNVTFSWSSTGATHHLLRVDDEPTFSDPQLLYTAVNGTSYLWSAPRAGTYYWRVNACNAVNCGFYPPEQSFTIPVQLLSPVGGESWAPGSQQVVEWTGNRAVKIELFADATSTSPDLAGPSIVLNAAAQSSPATVTIPTDIATTRARIRISTLGPDPILSSYSPNPFRVVTPPPAGVWNYSSVETPNHGWNQSDMCGNGSLGAEAVYFDYLGGQILKSASRTDKTQEAWTSVVAAGAEGMGAWPSIVRGSDGRLHVAFYNHTLGSAVLYYACRTGSTWSAPVPVRTINVVQGDCSIELDAAGVPLIAFNSGNYGPGSGQRKLFVFKQQPNLSWAQFGAMIPADSPHHLTLRRSSGNRFWLSYLDQGGARMNLWTYNTVQWVNLGASFSTGPYTDVSLAINQYLTSTPNLAYTVQAASGGQKLVFHPWAEDGLGLGTPFIVDESPGTIASVSLQYWGPYPRIAYVGNGVVKQATGVSSPTQWPVAWERGVVDATGNMDSQVSLVVTPSNDERWVLYRDLTTQSMRSASPYSPYSVDNTPPAATPQLTTSGSCADTIQVDWVATGDDGNTGQATSYDLKWSTSPINTEAAFNAAFAVPTGPPGLPGTAEHVTIEVGECSSIRYFALKIRDEVGNLSPRVSAATGVQTECPQHPGDCMELEEWTAEVSGAPRTQIASLGPNPARGVVTVKVGVSESDKANSFDLAIHDVTGRRIRSLIGESPGVGRHEYQWDLKSDRGESVATGLYFVRMRVGSRTLSQRLIVAR